MKLLNIFLLLVFSTLVFSSCHKNNDAPTVPATQLAGKYEGKFGTGSNTPSAFYAFNIKENGVLEEIKSSGEVVGVGTWTITGTNFRGSYQTTFHRWWSAQHVALLA